MARVVVLSVLLGVGAVALLLHFGHSGQLTRVRVLDLPAKVDGEVELFKTQFGRVLVRGPERLHFHRHTHETWIGDTEIRYAPPYVTHAWMSGVVFAAAPEDDPEYAGEADTSSSVTADRWMLDKLERISVSATGKLGSYSGDAAVYVLAGRGELDGQSIGPRQLAWVTAGEAVEVVAASPLTLVVFDPARTTVSKILKEGTKRYSQDDEELVIRDFFQDRRGGVFLDVGAGDYQRYSTTFYLEEQLGWSGVAVDALSEYAEDYRKHRKRTTFVNYLVTDKTGGPRKFYRAEGFPEVSSVSKPLAEQQARELSGNGAVSERTVPSTTLNDLLDRLHVREIDFLSMDIEEHEPPALAGFAIERFHPSLVCIEAHPAVRDAIWRYFRQHGYVRQDQYLAWDSANWYFAKR